MRITCILLAYLLSLPLFVGCGNTEESPESLNPIVLAQELPADDDIEGLYNLGIPRYWFKIKDPVLYVKYFRAKLLRQYGNIPEIHVIADMELKIRQATYPTHDEKIRYLKALYKLWPDKRTLADLEYQQRVEAEEKSVVVVYGNTSKVDIRKRLEEIYGRKLSPEEEIIEIALINGDKWTLQAFGWKVFPPVGPQELRFWKYEESEEFLEAFPPNGGVMLLENKPDE